jgi:hypothetical protein
VLFRYLSNPRPYQGLGGIEGAEHNRRGRRVKTAEALSEGSFNGTFNGLNKNVRIFRHLSLKHNFNNGGLHVLVVRILLSRE